MSLETWEKVTEWPVTGLSVLFIVVYAWQILAQPTGNPAMAAEWAMNIMWILFAVDYLISILLAPHKWEWFKRHLFDLAVVLLPMIRPLRVLRVLTALSALHRTSGMALRGRIIVYVSGSVAMLVFVGALAVLDAERADSGASIRTFGQALWWAFVTITTVGYGDYAPVTVTGRIVAFALMLAGIALIGVVTATLASWIVDEVSTDEKRTTEITRQQVVELSQQLDRMERRLNELNSLPITETKESESH